MVNGEWFKRFTKYDSLFMIHGQKMGQKLVERIIDLTSSKDIKQKPLAILKTLSDLLSTQCLLYSLKEDNGGFFLEYGYGKDWHISPSFYPFEGSLLGKCILAKKEIEVVQKPNKDLETEFQDSGLRYFSRVLYIPMFNGDRPVGILCIKDKKNGVSNVPKGLLITVARYLSSVWSTIQILRDKEGCIRKFSFLHEVNKALTTTMNLDKLIYIILTAVTVGDGMGFNRAALFLVNETTNMLQGIMGVGPDDTEEAGRIWEDYTINKKHLLDLIFFEEDNPPNIDSRFNESVKGIRLHTNEESILTRTVREKRAFNVLNAYDSPYNCSEIVDKFACKTFAVVPLIALEKALGVILVDNLYNLKPITQGDIEILMTFSNQAGVALENSLLYNELKETLVEVKELHTRQVQKEKLAALGEMAATLAHEIRNPLVSIGGLVRHLGKELEQIDLRKYLHLKAEEWASSRNFPPMVLPHEYLDKIKGEVLRLEGILNDVLNFSKDTLPTQPSFRTEDLNLIIQKTLETLEDELNRVGVNVVKKLSSTQLLAEADRYMLHHVFLNLISNSLQAMEEGGTLTIRSYMLCEDGKEWVVTEVEDTGGGIAPDVLENIFNPFFTTKEHGTGLGLAVTHNMVTSNHGSLEVKNIVGKGVIFIVKLPAFEGVVESKGDMRVKQYALCTDRI